MQIHDMTQQASIDMLARVVPCPAPIVRARPRIGQKGFQSGLADRSGIDPHEAAPRGIRAEREIDQRAGAGTRIVVDVYAREYVKKAD